MNVNVKDSKEYNIHLEAAMYGPLALINAH